MGNKKGRGILLKDSNRDPNAGRCLETWWLRRGLREAWGLTPQPDPGPRAPHLPTPLSARSSGAQAAQTRHFQVSFPPRRKAGRPWDRLTA